MTRYSVTVTRTESITFELDATDRDDAIDRYLMDGDEVGAKTVSIDVDHVEALS